MKKSDIYGIAGSAIFCGIILLLLLLIYMPGKQMPEDEGIIVSFGDSFSGGGSTPAPNVQAPSPVQPAPPVETPAPRTPTPAPSTPENVMTQEDNSVAIARQEEERRRREEEQAERKRKEEEQRRIEEQRRQEEERRLAEERRIAEQRQREQEALERANALGNMFGANDNSLGSGTQSGSEQQGNPAGRGSSDGNSWSLDGRALVGNLIKPTYTRNVEGIVTVSIRVNESGNVVSATMTDPITISDAQTINAAIEAAKKTKFSSGRSMVSGTITYHFRLN